MNFDPRDKQKYLDPTNEILKLFMESELKQITLFVGSERNIEVFPPGLLESARRKLPMLEVVRLGGRLLESFERNNTEITTRHPVSRGVVDTPALRLLFHSDTTVFSGHMDGRKNVEIFLIGVVAYGMKGEVHNLCRQPAESQT